MTMLRYLKCNRCGENSPNYDGIGPEIPPEIKDWFAALFNGPQFPVPTGHVSRHECWEAPPEVDSIPEPDLCPACVGEYRKWWMNPVKGKSHE